MNFKLAALITISIVSLAHTAHAEDKKFYGKLTSGLSILGDQKFSQSGVASSGATGKGDYSTGWVGGGALGYRITDNWATELALEYRNNGANKTRFSDGTNFNDGDFASLTAFANTYYRFDPVMKTKFRPYLGAGIGLVQEIDMDIKKAGGKENSYSADAEFAGQIMVGVEYPIAQNWDVSTEVRYMNVSNVKLKQENGTGRINKVDYDPVTVAIGLTYNF